MPGSVKSGGSTSMCHGWNNAIIVFLNILVFKSVYISANDSSDLRIDDLLLTREKSTHGNVFMEKKLDPEVFMNASELITSKGYPCEAHNIVTNDGYILGLQRIPHGRNEVNHSTNRPVVFLQHGLLCSSTNWLTNLENESLAYLLANEGFDVWLGNVRGNTYSTSHTHLDPTSRKFWDFSWDEMTQYDLPAMLNYALKLSGRKQLYYVGHSQGTLMGFTGYSINRDLAKKVKLFAALAPIVTVGYIKGPLRLIDPYAKDIDFFLKLAGRYDFLRHLQPMLHFLGRNMCSTEPLDIICRNLLFLIAGFDKDGMNTTRLPVYLNHTPSGTSTKNIMHFAQMVRTKKCQMYDYGYLGNLIRYGQLHPPEYDVRQMNVPVALFTGDHDYLADPTDVSLLIPKLRNLVFHKDSKPFDHLDFIWGLNAVEQVYKPLIKLIKKFENMKGY